MKQIVNQNVKKRIILEIHINIKKKFCIKFQTNK